MCYLPVFSLSVYYTVPALAWSKRNTACVAMHLRSPHWFPYSCICPRELRHSWPSLDVCSQKPCIVFQTRGPVSVCWNAVPRWLQVCVHSLPRSSLAWIIPLLWVLLGSSAGQGMVFVETLNRSRNPGWGVQPHNVGLSQGWRRGAQCIAPFSHSILSSR